MGCRSKVAAKARRAKRPGNACRARETDNGGKKMVNIYTEAKNKQGLRLERPEEEGEVRIKRGDGTTFSIKHADAVGSPQDVDGFDLS